MKYWIHKSGNPWEFRGVPAWVAEDDSGNFSLVAADGTYLTRGVIGWEGEIIKAICLSLSTPVSGLGHLANFDEDLLVDEGL